MRSAREVLRALGAIVRRRRRILYVLAVLVALDQILLWTFLTRPVSSLRSYIELTGDDEPPYFRLRPGLDTTYTSWRRGDVSHIHTSGLGLRGPEQPVEKRPGVRRVIMTGDSITFGIGVNDDEAFPQQLAAQLRAQGRADVEVWNAGVPGYAMADHLGLLRKRLLALAPDLVVLQLSKNDVAKPMPLGPTFLSLLRSSGFARLYMIVRFNFVDDADLFDRSFEAYLEACRAAGVRLLVVYEGLPRSTVVERLTRGAGVELLDIGAFAKLPDDPHYSAQGNRDVAAKLLPEVLALVDPSAP